MTSDKERRIDIRLHFNLAALVSRRARRSAASGKGWVILWYAPCRAARRQSERLVSLSLRLPRIFLISVSILFPPFFFLLRSKQNCSRYRRGREVEERGREKEGAGSGWSFNGAAEQPRRRNERGAYQRPPRQRRPPRTIGDDPTVVGYRSPTSRTSSSLLAGSRVRSFVRREQRGQGANKMDVLRGLGARGIRTRGAARSGATRARPGLPDAEWVYMGKLELTWCAVPSAVLASRSPSAPGPPPPRLLCHTTHARTGERRAPVPSQGTRGERQGPRWREAGGGPHRPLVAPRCVALLRRLSRRLTSPPTPTSKSPIMATRPRPPSLQQPRPAARRGRDAGRPFSVVTDAEPCENFTGTSLARGIRAHGLQKIQRLSWRARPAGTYARGALPGRRSRDRSVRWLSLGGGLGDAEKEIMWPVLQRNVARSARIPSDKYACWPLLVSPRLRAQSSLLRAARSLPVAGKPCDYESA